jgi:hypothetical protein
VAWRTGVTFSWKFVKSGCDQIVIGTLSSGTVKNKNKETITRGPWTSRNLAEQKALKEITKLLGNNERSKHNSHE